MGIVLNEELCLGCSLCVIECSEGAISARSVAEINKEKCIDCLSCIVCCPNNAIEEVQS